MATTSAALLRTSTEDDLERQLREAKEELFNLRFQAATGQLESHGRLRTVRRDIARIYTILRERELGIIGFIEPEAVPEPEPETKPEPEPETVVADGDEPEAKKSTAKKTAKKSTTKKAAAKKSTAKKSTTKKAAKADDADSDSADADAPAEDGDDK